MNHFFELVYSKCYLFILIHYFFPFIWVISILLSKVDFCYSYSSYLFFSDSAWTVCWLPYIYTLAFSYSNCFNCSPQQLNYLYKDLCISSRYFRFEKSYFYELSFINWCLLYELLTHLRLLWADGSSFIIYWRINEEV